MPIPTTAMNASRALSDAMKRANEARRIESGANKPRVTDKPSDEIYNARRRFSREAKRYLEDAQNAEGAMKRRYENLARENLSKALSTYSDKTPASKYSKDIKELMNTLGDVKAHPRKSTQELIEESYTQLRGSKNIDRVRRAREAEAILNSPVGSRIYGATVEIWKDAPDINQALMDYFEVDDMMGVIEKFESEFGETLYEQPEQQEKYDEVVARGQALWVA